MLATNLIPELATRGEQGRDCTSQSLITATPMKSIFTPLLLLSLSASLGAGSANAQATINYNSGVSPSVVGVWQFYAQVPGDARYQSYNLGASALPTTGGFQLDQAWGTSLVTGVEAHGSVSGYDWSGNFNASIYGPFVGTFEGTPNTLKLDLNKGEMEHKHWGNLNTGEEPPMRNFVSTSWQDNGRGLVYTAPFTVTADGVASVQSFGMNRSEGGPFGANVDGYSALSWRVDADTNGDGIWDGPGSIPLGNGSVTAVDNQTKSNPGLTFVIPEGHYTLRLVYDSGSQHKTYNSIPGPWSNIVFTSTATMSDDASFELNIQ